MSQTKFTSGEWLAKTTGVDGIKFGLVYIEGGGFDVSGAPDCEANAHLIAAAPDMYAALESHLSALGDLYALDIDDVLPEHEGEFRAVHALINKTELLLKKARGE